MRECLADLDTAVAAWVLGLVKGSDLPSVAAAALSQGIDAERLRRLAGLSPAEIGEASELFEQAIHDLGWSIPDRRQAALRYARCIARLIVSGAMTPRNGARVLWQASLAVEDGSFHDLDPFVYASSEYDDRPADHAMFDAAIINEAKRWAAPAPSLD